MSDNTLKIAVVKLGCIGAAPLLDLIIDERADREDIDVRAWTSGAKLDPDSCAAPTAAAIEWAPAFVILVSPNAALPGPKQARAAVAAAGLPVVVVGDGPSKKAFYRKNDEGKQELSVPDGQGFVILPFDPMIGARREFLDPSEMTLFNADVIKVLSACGAIRCLQGAIDDIVEALKSGQAPVLPRANLSAAEVVAAAGFGNPYAAAKALGALKIAEAVAGVTSAGCFAVRDADKYIPLVAAGHEMMRAAARLADEAREIEKSSDSLMRTPHAASGSPLSKARLLDKPA